MGELFTRFSNFSSFLKVAEFYIKKYCFGSNDPALSYFNKHHTTCDQEPIDQYY